jgi:hypothetical protein
VMRTAGPEQSCGCGVPKVWPVAVTENFEMAEREGFELEALARRLSRAPKSRVSAANRGTSAEFRNEDDMAEREGFEISLLRNFNNLGGLEDT